MSEALEAVLREELAKLDLELVEFRRGGSKSRPVLDVRIDRLDGTAVSIDDCARASRAIEARLDAPRETGASALVAERYVLEVSSPGVERPLLTVAHWRRFVGQQVVVNSAALGGRAEYRLEAVEGEAEAEQVVLVDRNSVEHRVPLTAIAEARLAFHWKR